MPTLNSNEGDATEERRFAFGSCLRPGAIRAPRSGREARSRIYSFFDLSSIYIDAPPASHPITRFVPLAHAVFSAKSRSTTQLFPSAHAGLLWATEREPMNHAQMVVPVPFNHAPPQIHPARSRGMTLAYEVRPSASRSPRAIFPFNHARQIQPSPNTAGNRVESPPLIHQRFSSKQSITERRSSEKPRGTLPREAINASEHTKTINM